MDGVELVRRYLQDAIAAEKSFEAQFRSFSAEGDDSEVSAAFGRHAQETRSHHERLTTRLEELGGNPSLAKGLLAQVFALAPRSAQVPHREEERIAQNLIAAFSIEAGECAMYEALACIANRAGDSTTESLARQIQAEEKQMASIVWRFIPSRAKIAFNVVTAGEVDPAVETRAGENRLL
jgi:ferritin-like metal-binding protein YciE